MSSRRVLRLAALVLIIVGTAATVAVLAGWQGGDATAAYPVSAALGWIILWVVRPRRSAPAARAGGASTERGSA